MKKKILTIDIIELTINMDTSIIFGASIEISSKQFIKLIKNICKKII